MSKWKITLMWLGLIGYRVGSAMLLVHQNNEMELVRRDNTYFWGGYAMVWMLCLYSSEEKGSFLDVLYCLAWVFLIGMSGYGMMLILWVVIQGVFGIKVGFLWGEFFNAIYLTLCLLTPIRLAKRSKRLQENL